MTDIAWRNLSRERTRLAISVGGVAFAVLLILVIRGLYVGITAQATSYIRSVRADVWVAQAGTPGDFFHSISLLRDEVGEKIAAVDGVASVDPLVGRPVVFPHRGEDIDFYLLGVDPSTGRGAAESAVEGRRVPRAGEVVVDQVFAQNSDISVGDELELRGRTLRVAGIARGGNAVIAQFAWTTLDDMRVLLGAQGVVNYFIVRGNPGTDAQALAERITTDVAGTNALSDAEFQLRNTADLREGFLPIVLVLVVIAFVIGTVIIGLTIYTATMEKKREYGVLKAIGFSNRRLAGVVGRQSLVAGAAGFVVGVIGTFALRAALERVLPSFVTVVGVVDLLTVGALAVAMSLLAALVPLRPLMRLDPAEVFRA